MKIILASWIHRKEAWELQRLRDHTERTTEHILCPMASEFCFCVKYGRNKKVMTAVAGSWWKAGIIFLFFKKNSSEVIKSSLGGCTSCEVCSPAIPWMLIRGVGSQVVAALQRVPPMYSAFLWLVIDFENCYLSLSFNCELFWVW